MTTIEADLLILGHGLGASVAARIAAATGARVVMVPGVGRTRSPQQDAVLLPPAHTFLARELAAVPQRSVRLPDGMASTVIRRDLAEAAMREAAIAAGVRYERSFTEGPADIHAGAVTIADEQGGGTITAARVAICEGGDPRLASHLGLRPDDAPDDLLNFARTIVRTHPPDDRLQQRDWRDVSGMPIRLTQLPMTDGLLVSACGRLENTMRSSRSLPDALASWLRETGHDVGAIGVELVPLRRSRSSLVAQVGPVVLGIDAAGVIDPRRVDRASLTWDAGLVLGACLTEPAADWQAAASAWIAAHLTRPVAPVDDRATGFLEEAGASRQRSWLRRLTRRP